MNTLMSQLASDKMLDRAFEAVCHKLKNSSCNNGIWDLRLKWGESKTELQRQLLQGTYSFTATNVRLGQFGWYEQWEVTDQVVLKAMQNVMRGIFTPHVDTRCYNLKGRGGLKGAVGSVADAIKKYKYIYKSDIASYYTSIDHEILLKKLSKYIPERDFLNLINRFLCHSKSKDGAYHDTYSGISRGTSISYLLGIVYLMDLDDVFTRKKSCFYVRYMDDFICMTNNKQLLRRCIRKANTVLTQLKLITSFEKTFIGNIAEEGIDFLGFRICAQGVRAALDTIYKFKQKCTAKVHRWWNRFYESGLNGLEKLKGEPTLAQTISQYEKNWIRWSNGRMATHLGMRPN